MSPSMPHDCGCGYVIFNEIGEDFQLFYGRILGGDGYCNRRPLTIHPVHRLNTGKSHEYRNSLRRGLFFC